MEVIVTKTYEVDVDELEKAYPKELEEAEDQNHFIREAIENMLGHDPHNLLFLTDEEVDIDYPNG